MKQSRQAKKYTTNERLDILEKMAVRLSLQMNAILKALHTDNNKDN